MLSEKETKEYLDRLMQNHATITCVDSYVIMVKMISALIHQADKVIAKHKGDKLDASQLINNFAIAFTDSYLATLFKNFAAEKDEKVPCDFMKKLSTIDELFEDDEDDEDDFERIA